MDSSTPTARGVLERCTSILDSHLREAEKEIAAELAPLQGGSNVFDSLHAMGLMLTLQEQALQRQLEQLMTAQLQLSQRRSSQLQVPQVPQFPVPMLAPTNQVAQTQARVLAETQAQDLVAAAAAAASSTQAVPARAPEDSTVAFTNGSSPATTHAAYRPLAGKDAQADLAGVPPPSPVAAAPRHSPQHNNDGSGLVAFDEKSQQLQGISSERRYGQQQQPQKPQVVAAAVPSPTKAVPPAETAPVSVGGVVRVLQRQRQSWSQWSALEENSVVRVNTTVGKWLHVRVEADTAGSRAPQPRAFRLVRLPDASSRSRQKNAVSPSEPEKSGEEQIDPICDVELIRSISYTEFRFKLATPARRLQFVVEIVGGDGRKREIRSPVFGANTSGTRSRATTKASAKAAAKRPAQQQQQQRQRHPQEQQEQHHEQLQLQELQQMQLQELQLLQRHLQAQLASPQVPAGSSGEAPPFGAAMGGQSSLPPPDDFDSSASATATFSDAAFASSGFPFAPEAELSRKRPAPPVTAEQGLAQPPHKEPRTAFADYSLGFESTDGNFPYSDSDAMWGWVGQS